MRAVMWCYECGFSLVIFESYLWHRPFCRKCGGATDAIPGQVFMGRVSKIAPLPDAQSAWLNPDLKVYPTQIHLDGSHPELRTGMNCQAEIIVEQHTDGVKEART